MSNCFVVKFMWIRCSSRSWDDINHMFGTRWLNKNKSSTVRYVQQKTFNRVSKEVKSVHINIMQAIGQQEEAIDRRIKDTSPNNKSIVCSRNPFHTESHTHTYAEDEMVTSVTQCIRRRRRGHHFCDLLSRSMPLCSCCPPARTPE